MCQRVLVGVKPEPPFFSSFYCPTTRHRYRGHSDPVSVSLPLWFCCHQRSATGDDCFGWVGGKRGRRRRPTCTSFTSPTVTAVRDSNIFFAGLLKKIVLFHSSWILCFLVSQVNASLLGIQAQKRGRAPFFFLGKRRGGRPQYSERISGEKSFLGRMGTQKFCRSGKFRVPEKRGREEKE